VIHFVCWKWKHPTYRTPYTAEHVNTLLSMLDRHYKAEHRLICITDDPLGVECTTYPLWDDCNNVGNPSGPHFPSCYRRLKLFSVEQLKALGIEKGERLVSMDLDIVITSNVTPLFKRKEPFVGWRGKGTHHPIVYNGSLFTFEAGAMTHLWEDFNPSVSPLQTRDARFFGSDQAWLSYKLNGSVPGWDCEDGVYSYSRDVINVGRSLPNNARIVSFNGKRKPWDPAVQGESPWIKKHWRM